MSKTVMWFRKDLRFEDNTAFSHMLEEHEVSEELICLFQLNPAQFLENSFNQNAFFLSLKTFQQTAKAKNRTIHFLYGEVIDSFSALKKAYPEWDHIYFNQDERGYGKQRDELASAFFKENDIQISCFQDSHLHGVQEVKKPDGEAYKVFTPYFKKWSELPKRKYEQRDDDTIVFADLTHDLFVQGQKQFQMMTERLTLPFDYLCGEQEAEKYLKEFIKNRLHDYQKNRDYPAKNDTSKLSRFLRTGELSIRKVWQAVIAEPESDGRQTFISELCWRDFYNMIYFENPNQKNQEIKKKYRHLSWSYDKKRLEAWKTGQTGYPLVDAAMRQLNQTGWMHNRLRMVVASFLTKDLLIDWREGEKYFQEKLIDYDSASNIGGWQWAASTGTDAVPYFRIFNPINQSEKFDKYGSFIRQFVPELEQIPNKYIHSPNKMNEEQQKSANCVIGKDYPFPIVDHSKQRQKILTFFKEQEDN